MNNDVASLHLKKMTETPIPKLITLLAIPTIISMLVSNIYNLVDTYFVGKLGVSASGAIGVIFTLMAILQAIGFMLGHGSGSVISRLLAKKEIDKARALMSLSEQYQMPFGTYYFTQACTDAKTVAETDFIIDIYDGMGELKYNVFGIAIDIENGPYGKCRMLTYASLS